MIAARYPAAVPTAAEVAELWEAKRDAQYRLELADLQLREAQQALLEARRRRADANRVFEAVRQRYLEASEARDAAQAAR